MKIFGPDRFFFELQQHDIRELEVVNQDLDRVGAPLSGEICGDE